MRELFPFDRVVHLTDEDPQDPSRASGVLVGLACQPPARSAGAPRRRLRLGGVRRETGGSARRTLRGRRPRALDRAGERSGDPRESPSAHWEQISALRTAPLRVRRVSIVGPESTGKTTLARRLADRFGTVWVPEWARTMLERRNGSLEGLDWTEIVRGQIASEEARARDANRVLICDTDPIVTPLWAETLLGACPPEVSAAAHGPGMTSRSSAMRTSPGSPTGSGTWRARERRSSRGASRRFATPAAGTWSCVAGGRSVARSPRSSSRNWCWNGPYESLARQNPCGGRRRRVTYAGAPCSSFARRR